MSPLPALPLPALRRAGAPSSRPSA
jgi:hypothetical protein